MKCNGKILRISWTGNKTNGSIREELIDGLRTLKIKTHTEAEVLYVGHLKVIWKSHLVGIGKEKLRKTKKARGKEYMQEGIEGLSGTVHGPN